MPVYRLSVPARRSISQRTVLIAAGSVQAIITALAAIFAR